MAKRRTPGPRRPVRRRPTAGGSTRRSTSRGARVAGTSRRPKPAKAKPRRPTPSRSKTSARTSAAPKGRQQKPAPKAVTTRAPKRPKVAAPAKVLKKGAGRRPAVARASAPRSAPPRQQAGRRVPGSLREQVERDRRLVEETVHTPPSTLNLDRHASAARTGRAEFNEALAAHTESSPALTGGDVDADWESAYSSGDEAPGGDMPTPDQGVVEDIGVALGVEYQDDEELKGAVKIEERDRHRWELDPASAEDYRDRGKPERRKGSR